MSRDWHQGYDFCDGSDHSDDGSDNGKQGNLVNIRSEMEKDEGMDLFLFVTWCRSKGFIDVGDSPKATDVGVVICW